MWCNERTSRPPYGGVMDTTKCMGCGATIFTNSGTCPRCGFTRHTTAIQRVAFGITIFAISALVYGIWTLIPQVMASM
jgi:hypothetical protein